MVSLSKFSISKRLGIGLGLIIAFMVVLTLTGIWSLATMNGKVEQITNINNAKIELAYTIKGAVDTVDKSIVTSFMANDPSTTETEKKRIADARTVFIAAVEKLSKLERSEKGKGLIEGIQQNFTIAQNANDRVLELASAGNMGSAGTLLTGSAQISKMLSDACDEMVKFQQERTAVGAKEAAAAYFRGRYVLLIMGAAVFAFAVFLAYFLARSITKPLSEGVSVANRIADGDLTARIDTHYTDETGQLLNAMSNMVGKLQGIIGEVKTAAGNMASASHQLNENSELMSHGANEQAGRASQVATASEEMSQTIMDIARNTSSIESSATDTAKLAKSGEQVVGRSVEKVKAIARTIGESAQLIGSLGERSAQIGQIINVINDIADQTNLLALNAAIEAARAGEVGRGFAVVADEVKKLAERAGNSTAEIGGMIKSIQDEVRRVVVSMESITKEVTLGVELSTEAGGVLRTIVGSVDQLHIMVQQIASATEEMAATSEEINRDIETIASVSQTTSGNSDQISQASQRLADLSAHLEDAVAGFKV